MTRILAALLASMMLATTTTGCIGRMAVSGKVGEFNLSVTEGRFARWLVFLLLYVVMVYPIAGLIDLLIVNSLEFWSGTNPVSDEKRLARAGETRYIEAGDGSVATMTLREDGSIDVEATTQSGELHRFNLMREAGSVVARDEMLEPIARVNADGRLERVLAPGG